MSRFLPVAPGPREFGGAALEYVLVSTFAAVVTVAALAFIGKAFKDQLGRMAERLGVEADGLSDLDAVLGTNPGN